MRQHQSELIRESEAHAEERLVPSASDLLFTAGLSLAIIAGLGLGFVLR
jgi:hypothetical protein